MARRHAVLGTPEQAWQQSQACTLRCPGLCEETTHVWIGGKEAEILGATMEGVTVRLPPGLVTFKNKDDGEDAEPREAWIRDSALGTERAVEGVESGELKEGARLHDEVERHRWCVTLEDLKELRELVRRAVREGLIQPVHGNFDPNDMEDGPNIHTVNEQFIKKVTRAMGGMSWALMKHPEGLPCDLFITHSWEEGIFEFLNKVIFSWPPEAKHAYCCMFSNPQNLNIAHILNPPSQSPFATSLREAKFMMVVPNSKISIYTRLWCAYEAYKAYVGKKSIFTATLPMRRTVACRLGVVSAFLAWGWLERAAEGAVSQGQIAPGFLLAPFALLALTLLSGRTSPEKYMFCCVGAKDASYVMAACFYQFLYPSWSSRDFNWRLMACVRALGMIYLVISIYFCISVIDHVSANVRKNQSHQLKKGYRGSVRFAECSRVRDKIAIQKEMQGEDQAEKPLAEEPEAGRAENPTISKVDNTIKVLIDAGLSTESTRNAQVKLERVASVQWGPAVMALLSAFPFYFNLSDDDAIRVGSKILVVLDAFLAARLVWLLRKMEPDRRAIAVACIHKVHIIFPFLIILSIRCSGSKEALHFSFMLLAGAGLLAKLICNKLVSMTLPEIVERFGRCFAQALVTHGFGSTRRIFTSAGRNLTDNLEVATAHDLLRASRATMLQSLLRRRGTREEDPEEVVELPHRGSAGSSGGRSSTSEVWAAQGRSSTSEVGAAQDAAAWERLICDIRKSVASRQ